MMKTKENKRDFKFGGRASAYDGEFEGRLSEKVYNLVTETVVLSQHDRVLDVGCGTGTILKRLSDKCDIIGYGIDIEEEMIQQAKKKCPQMEIFKCDCSNTPFEDNSFDSVVACMTFHHFHDQTAFAKEVSRLLKTGGRLYLADPVFPYILRKIINAILDIHKVVGKFNTAKEIEQIFRPYGIIKREVIKEGFYQLIVLEKLGG